MKRTACALAVGIAIGAAAVAAPVYLSHHRKSVKGSTEPRTVLVAKRLIPKGTSGSSIAAQNLFVVKTIPKVQIAPRAISDPAVLQGRATAADIYPNEQLATSDFTTPH
jgi:flagella basal body P-ring formation protein FlgA